MTEDLTVDVVVERLLENFGARPPRVQRQLLEMADRARRKQTSLPEWKLPHQLGMMLLHKERLLTLDKAAEGLFEDLASVGLVVDTVQDLKDLDPNDHRAVPILLTWLATTSYPGLKSEIIGTLHSSWAKPAVVAPLFEEFSRIDPAEDPDPNSIRWQIASVLQRFAGRDSASALLRIADDARNGDSRSLMILAFKRFRKDTAQYVPKMLEFLNSADPILSMSAAEVLGQWRVIDARPRILELLAEAKVSDSEGTGNWFQLDLLKKAARRFEQPLTT